MTHRFFPSAKRRLRIRNDKGHFLRMETGKKEFSAVVVKAFKSFSSYVRCLTARPGRAVRSWRWRGTSMVRGLISERSYPWAVEPAGLNGSIQHQLSGEGSGGEVEALLRLGAHLHDPTFRQVLCCGREVRTCRPQVRCRSCRILGIALPSSRINLAGEILFAFVALEFHYGLPFK